MNTATTAEPTIKDFQTRQELFESDLPVYTKAQLLAQWDAAHKDEPPEKPRLNTGEREQLAEFAAKLKALKTAHVGLAGNLEKYRAGQEQGRAEMKRLETTLHPDDSGGIKSLIYMRCRQEILDRFVNTAPDRLREIDRAAEDIFFRVDQILSRRFGADMKPGGRYFGAASLPGKIDIGLAAIEAALRRK
jgi:hypothetical protein